MQRLVRLCVAHLVPPLGRHGLQHIGELPVRPARLEASPRQRARVSLDVQDDRGLVRPGRALQLIEEGQNRKSTRLNSSHLVISYAVFCLKKKTPERASY